MPMLRVSIPQVRNKITSRIEAESVSSITNRSIPMPSPAGRQAIFQRRDVVLIVCIASSLLPPGSSRLFKRPPDRLMASVQRTHCHPFARYEELKPIR